MFETPILLMVFARPDTTKIVFERIREIKPKKLYIAADAPRQNRKDEIVRAKKTREIFDNIDWDCKVEKLFREENLGCGRAISGAISWFFEKEEYGIILEDDCLADKSFFDFAQEMLIKYKDDNRIGHISGNCYYPEKIIGNYSYNFSKICHIWGWATWKRVWQTFDINFNFWNIANKKEKNNIFVNYLEKIYFWNAIEKTIKKKDIWSIQYYYQLRLNNQICIYPKVNMVENIGFSDKNATHTFKKTKQISTKARKINFPLVHPDNLLVNKELDKKTIRNIFFSYTRLAKYFFSILTNIRKFLC